MTISEALDALNTEDINKLIVLYFKDYIEDYLGHRKKINDLKGQNIRLRNTGHDHNPSNDGYIKDHNKEIEYIKNSLPDVISIDELVKIYKSMSKDELNQTLSDEDKNKVENYIDRLKLRSKLPDVGQKFKFSYLYVIYEVVSVDIDSNKIGYKASNGSFSDDMSIDYFLDQKNKNRIRYV